MQSKHSPFIIQQQTFKTIVETHSLSGLLSRTKIAHAAFLKEKDEQVHRDDTVTYFYVPLQTMILNSAKLFLHLKDFLITIYRDTTLLDKITGMLHEYYVEKEGKGSFPELILTKTDLKRLGCSPEKLPLYIEHLNCSLHDKIVFNWKRMRVQEQFTCAKITFHFTETIVPLEEKQSA